MFLGGNFAMFPAVTGWQHVRDQLINQSILFAQNVQRYTYKAIQLRAGQQG